MFKVIFWILNGVMLGSFLQSKKGQAFLAKLKASSQDYIAELYAKIYVKIR